MSPVMPFALPVDQTLAKELYLNGMSLTQVAKRTGVKLMTLGAWKNRGNWDAERLKPDSSEETAVQAAAKALSNQALTLTSRILCKAEKMGIESPGDLKNVSSAVASAVGVARKTLGLDDKQGSNGKAWGGGISIDVHLSPGSSFSVGENKVIDVTPKQLPE